MSSEGNPTEEFNTARRSSLVKSLLLWTAPDKSKKTDNDAKSPIHQTTGSRASSNSLNLSGTEGHIFEEKNGECTTETYFQYFSTY